MQSRIAIAVAGIQHSSDDEPDREAIPRRARQTHHDEQTRERAQRRDDPREWHLEWTRTLGLLDAQDEYTHANEHEREQRPDVGEVVGLRRVANERCERHDDTGDER